MIFELPSETFFSWLSEITAETRDLDVFLLNFERYKNTLPAQIRQSINPLLHLLNAKKSKSQKLLAKRLRSNRYLTGMAKWEEFLSTPMDQKAAPTPSTSLTIKELADQRIWKVYKKIIKDGDAINPKSLPEELHHLRKTCKKLRYLIEFFSNLYPAKKTDKLLKHLKALQSVLGDYQDYAIQQEKLEEFSEEMQTVNVPAKTFIAMGYLIQDFEKHKEKSRKHFDTQFKQFKKTELGFKKPDSLKVSAF
jgi:CHAD domain-containing protein